MIIELFTCSLFLMMKMTTDSQEAATPKSVHNFFLPFLCPSCFLAISISLPSVTKGSLLHLTCYSRVVQIVLPNVVVKTFYIISCCNFYVDLPMEPDDGQDAAPPAFVPTDTAGLKEYEGYHGVNFQPGQYLPPPPPPSYSEAVSGGAGDLMEFSR